MGRSHKNTNTVFGLINPVYDMDKYIFMVNVFIKQARYEYNTVFVSSPRVLNM